MILDRSFLYDNPFSSESELTTLEKIFLPTLRYYYYYFANERMSRFNTIAKRKKKKKFLTIIWKLIIWLLDIEILIDIVTYHFEEWKIEDWNFLCCRSKRVIIEMNEMYVNLKKGENIGRNKGQVWKGRKDEGMKRKKFARSRIIDHGFVLCSVF